MAKEKLISTNTLLYYHTALKNLLGDKVDKQTGYSLMSDTEITRLSSVVNYDDTAIRGILTTMEGQINALESGTYDDTTLKAEISATYASIANLETHTTNSDIHITASERTAWNAKADASALTALETTINGKALQADLDDVADDVEALTTTVGNKADTTALTSHTGDTDIHITATERTNWNAKADQTDLDDLNTKVNNIVSNGVSYCGAVATFADLPSTDVSKGDMYSVTTAGTDGNGDAFLAGTNFVWDGTKWDNCGGILDYAVIYTTGDMAQNSDIDTILNS